MVRLIMTIMICLDFGLALGYYYQNNYAFSIVWIAYAIANIALYSAGRLA